MKIVRGLYGFFKSVQLAAVLIAYLFLLAIAAGVSGRANLVSSSTWGRLLLLIPLCLFIINLTVCSANRIVKLSSAGVYARRWGILRAGPDLIHAAVLLFVLGGLLSLYGRVEGVAVLLPGEEAVIQGEYSLRLIDFTISRYPDGRPREYVSEVQLLRGGSPIAGPQELQVNRPLEFGRLKIYQRGYEELGALDNQRPPGGDEGGPPRPVNASVLQAVYDPGFGLILWAGILLTLGLGLLMVDKLKSI
ncbi:MAG: cytochrome c biogenesis protein ResB [Sediminispirochaetaceae bacterium]